jgi:hypothetical protein
MQLDALSPASNLQAEAIGGFSTACALAGAVGEASIAATEATPNAPASDMARGVCKALRNEVLLRVIVISHRLVTITTNWS